MVMLFLVGLGDVIFRPSKERLRNLGKVSIYFLLWPVSICFKETREELKIYFSLVFS